MRELRGWSRGHFVKGTASGQGKCPAAISRGGKPGVARETLGRQKMSEGGEKKLEGSKMLYQI